MVLTYLPRLFYFYLFYAFLHYVIFSVVAKRKISFILLIFIILFSICDAIIDKVDNAGEWDKSIFSNIKRHYWREWFKYDSWTLKYNGEPYNKYNRVKWNFKIFKINKPVQLTDAKHFFKMWREIFICLAIMLWLPLTETWEYLVYFAIYYVTLNGTFVLFHTRLFNRK